jgi:hypothetical protein
MSRRIERDPPPPPNNLLGRALVAATRGSNIVPPGLGIAAAGGLLAVGLAPVAAVVGALSAVTWGALVAWDLAGSPGPGPGPGSNPDPDPDPDLAPHFAQALTAIRAAAARVREPIDQHDGVLSDSLLEVGAATDDLVSRAEALVRRGDAIARHIRGSDPQRIEQEMQQREASAASMRDAAAAASLRMAADAKRRELATWAELRDQHARIVAELVAVESSLDALRARVVALTLNDPGDASAGATIGAELHELGERLDVLERAAAATIRSIGST